MNARMVLLVAPLLMACAPKAGGSVKRTRLGEDPTPPIIEKTLPDGLILQEIDISVPQDGRADVFNYLQVRTNAPRLIVRKEADLNMDGTIDTITFFNEEGDVQREETDRDFDGRLDWIDHYQNGLRVMSEIDTNGDGKMNVFSYYEGQPVPKITRKERDTNADGLIDVWERFDGDGYVTKTGRDTDGDGKMDEREE